MALSPGVRVRVGVRSRARVRVSDENKI